MPRTEKVSTTLTEDEKSDFRVHAAEHDMNMSQYLRELIYDDLETAGYETSRADDDGDAADE